MNINMKKPEMPVHERIRLESEKHDALVRLNEQAMLEGRAGAATLDGNRKQKIYRKSVIDSISDWFIGMSQTAKMILIGLGSVVGMIFLVGVVLNLLDWVFS